MIAEHLDLSRFNSLLRTRRLGKAAGFANEVWQTLDSTNARALQLAREGAPEGVVVLARRQTAGKGRLGRKWESPLDAGLYLSLLLRPNLSPAVLPIISFAAGVAAVDACRDACGLEPRLKWVNDIVYGGKKLGGILAESERTGGATATVVGIGINLRPLSAAGAPQEVAAGAVSLEETLGAPVDANQLAAALVGCLEEQYAQLAESGDAQEILRRWKKRAATLGKEVKAVTGERELVGVACDLAPDGALIIELADGERIALRAGDVTLRNADGTYA